MFFLVYKYSLKVYKFGYVILIKFINEIICNNFMKLLLTSNGICNESLKKTLKELVGKEEIRTAFIPTAANQIGDDKDWLIKNLYEFHQLGYTDIIDIAVLDMKLCLERIKKCNVICVGGGDTTYLIEKMRESGFDKELNELLKTRVYVGISAGSIVTCKSIWGSSEYVYDKISSSVPKGLGFVDFNFIPHLNSEDFPKVKFQNFEKISKENPGEEIYVCDNESGLKIEDGEIEIISEGETYYFLN